MIKNLPADAGAAGLTPGVGRSLEVGNGNPLQYSCLKSSMDRIAQQATVRGVTESNATGGSSTHARLVHLTVQAKPMKHCKAVIFQ